MPQVDFRSAGGSGGGGSGVSSFNTRSGSVTLLAADVTGVGGVVGSQQALGNLGSTKTLTLTTAFTEATGTLNANCALTIAGLTAGWSGVLLFQQDATGGRTLSINTASVTIPTAANAFVSVQFWTPDGTNLYVLPGPQSGAVSSVFTRTGAVTATSGDYTVAQVTGAAPLASPTLTGTPAAPTATALTNTTQIATTAYTDAAVTAFKTATGTLTNKRVTRRVVTVTQSATPAINTDNTDVASITALAQAITSMTSSLTGTPVDGDSLVVRITDNGTARGITWGSSFEASTVALPTTTAISAMLVTGFIWNTVTSKWRCVAVA